MRLHVFHQILHCIIDVPASKDANDELLMKELVGDRSHSHLDTLGIILIHEFMHRVRHCVLTQELKLLRCEILLDKSADADARKFLGGCKVGVIE